MKQRFSSLDVRIMSHELSKTLVGLRVQNIYDLSSRIFLIKFQKPDHREQLIVDSGFRCHLTSFVRTTAAEPSPFVRRLRKFLGTRRVTSVSQVGTDRIIEFQLSDGLYRLYLEFYAGGNIVVTDKDLNILALLRNVSEGEEHEQLKIGVKYDLSSRQNYDGIPELTTARIKAGLEAVAAKEKPAVPEEGKGSKKKSKSSLRKALAVSIQEFPPILVDHALRVHGFDASISTDEVIASAELLDDLYAALKEAQTVVSDITSSERTKGYIIAKKRKTDGITPDKESNPEDLNAALNLIYDDFQPFRPKQFEDNEDLTYLEFEGFNKTVDEFFSSIEGQKLDSRLQERELIAKKKLAEARSHHEKRLGTLQDAQELNIRKAEAIQANMRRVEEATAAVNGLIAQGMDWVDMARLIEAEQGRGNQVAQSIKLPLKLYENTITLLLGEPEPDDDSGYIGSDSEDEGSDSDEEQNTATTSNQRQEKRLTIDIDLSLSAWANASEYYDQKKTAAQKEERTAQQSRIALKNVERKVVADLKKGLNKEKDILRPVRRHFWFEKFYYFISSDGYLVLGGKDVQQNELLYNKYFEKGDIFVHAEITGASIVVIKNNPATPNAPIPPSTLSQAGTFSVASSSAWDSNAVMPAWWVNFDQVSKLATTGDYLGPGLFQISGDKTFLPAAQLLVGVGLLYQISEESRVRHIKHRIQGDSTTPTELAIATESQGDGGADKDEDLDSEDGFPDAKPAGAGNSSDEDENFPDPKPQLDDDSDEDFPDAKLQLDDDSDEAFPDVSLRPASDSDEEEDAIIESNPLQRASQTSARHTADSPLPEPEKIEKAEDMDDSISIADTVTTIGDRKPGTRHISAKERRLLRKGLNPDLRDRSQTASPAPTSRGSGGDEQEDLSDTKSNATTQTVRQLPRGKRSKQKKAASKYAEQDEEDRKTAAVRLGLKTENDRKALEAAARQAKEEEAAAQKQRRREQHLRAQAIGKAAEEARRAKTQEAAVGAEDDSNEPDEATKRQDLLDLSSLIGRPLPGDEIMAVIPICAPWTALSSMKYKAKMQPGAVKKGKAAREILGKWQFDSKVPKNLDQKSEDPEKIWPREADLIAGLKDVELIAVIPVGRVRVMMAGAQGGGKDSAKKGGKSKGKAGRGGRGSKR